MNTGADSTMAIPAYGLMGRRFTKSLYPGVFEEFGMDHYELIDLEPEAVESFIQEPGWRLLNVASPYMQAAAQTADEVSKNVFLLGSANTLIRRPDGTVFAENTDMEGIGRLLECFCQAFFKQEAALVFQGAKALICGYGPQSKAFCEVLKTLGCRISIVSGQGDELTCELSLHQQDADFFINTTSIGSYPNCPVCQLRSEDFAALPQLKGVIDVISNPRYSGLCLEAEKRKIPVIGGLPLITTQAAYALRALKGEKLQEHELEAIEKRASQKFENIIMIGMPSAGKTTTGRLLAKYLQRPFVDIDEAICLECGCSVEYLINYDGIDKFRDIETELCKRYGSRRGLVIACGGGVVTREPNYDLLHQNGRLLFLDRPFNELILDGRPVSKKQGLGKLAGERMGLYHSWSDVRLSTSGSPEQDAQRAAELLGYSCGS